MFSRKSCHGEVIRMVIFNTVSVKMYRNVIPICIWCAGMEIPVFVRKYAIQFLTNVENWPMSRIDQCRVLKFIPINSRQSRIGILELVYWILQMAKFSSQNKCLVMLILMLFAVSIPKLLDITRNLIINDSASPRHSFSNYS